MVAKCGNMTVIFVGSPEPCTNIYTRLCGSLSRGAKKMETQEERDPVDRLCL